MVQTPKFPIQSSSDIEQILNEVSSDRQSYFSIVTKKILDTIVNQQLYQECQKLHFYLQPKEQSYPSLATLQLKRPTLQALKLYFQTLVVTGLNKDQNPEEESDKYNFIATIIIHDDIEALKKIIELNTNLNISIPTFYRSPLHMATCKNQERIVYILLTQGKADPNLSCKFAGDTPLQRAARYGYTRILQMLLNANAAIDQANNSGYTAVHKAAEYGQLDSLNILIHAGANPNSITDSTQEYLGETPLHLAARNGHINAVTCLLKTKKVSLGACDKRGHTVLHTAASYGHANIVSTLLQAGANTETRNNDGYTPLEIARRNNDFGFNCADVIQAFEQKSRNHKSALQ